MRWKRNGIPKHQSSNSFWVEFYYERIFISLGLNQNYLYNEELNNNFPYGNNRFYPNGNLGLNDGNRNLQYLERANAINNLIENQQVLQGIEAGILQPINIQFLGVLPESLGNSYNNNPYLSNPYLNNEYYANNNFPNNLYQNAYNELYSNMYSYLQNLQNRGQFNPNSYNLNTLYNDPTIYGYLQQSRTRGLFNQPGLFNQGGILGLNEGNGYCNGLDCRSSFREGSLST